MAKNVYAITASDLGSTLIAKGFIFHNFATVWHLHVPISKDMLSTTRKGVFGERQSVKIMVSQQGYTTISL